MLSVRAVALRDQLSNRATETSEGRLVYPGQQVGIPGVVRSMRLIGNYAKLSVSITFNPNFAGTLHLYPTNNAGAAKTYQSMETWLVR